MRAEALATLTLGVAACAGPLRTAPAPSLAHAQLWLSTPDRTQLLQQQPSAVRHVADTAPGTRIAVDVTQRFQVMVGFGAALTDASAELLHRRLGPPQRDTVLQELFGRSAGGVGFSFVRLTIGGSDFSRTHTTYDDVPPGTRDDSLQHFSLADAERDVVPLVRAARRINPQLTVMATPWSAPAWMKSSRSLVTGTLDTTAYDVFARYLRRYVQGMAQRGVPIALLSVQNEPHFEPKDYPGMRLDPAQRARVVGRHLGPELETHGVRTAILDWDHNWDDPQSPLGVLADPLARRYVRGVAWHCYAGEPSAQSMVHDAHPDVDTYFTECAGGAWAPDFGANLRWTTKTLVIGATRHWARGVALWNLALDGNHGPHLGGCGNCRGVLTIDSASGRVTRNEEFYALAHASRFVRPGAVRVASTSRVDDLDTVAFVNADDGTRVLLVVNSADRPRAFTITDGAATVRTSIPAGAVATYVWR